jgi:hypothetical protein
LPEIATAHSTIADSETLRIPCAPTLSSCGRGGATKCVRLPNVRRGADRQISADGHSPCPCDAPQVGCVRAMPCASSVKCTADHTEDIRTSTGEQEIGGPECIRATEFLAAMTMIVVDESPVWKAIELHNGTSFRGI